MKCDFEEKECNIRCQYYHTCTRSVQKERAGRGKERQVVRKKQISSN